MTVKLFNEITGKEVKIGDRIETFRGEVGILENIGIPGTSQGGRGGRVYIRIDGTAQLTASSYFPGVINCEFKEC